MVADVRYLFGSLASGQIIAELPLTSVSMNRKLNDWGTFRGTIYWDTSGIDNHDLVAALATGRNFIVCERDDVPVWDGILWTTTYDSQAKVMNFSGRTYEAYPDKCVVNADFIRTATDQRNIFCDLWNALQADPTRNLGISIPPSTFTNEVQRDLSILATEYKTYYSGMSAMSDGDNGFDYTITTTRNVISGLYTRTLQIGYPMLGIQNETASPLSFDYPGNVLNYYESTSMTNAATHLYLLGAGEGSDMVVGTAVQSDLIGVGWKRYDAVESRKDVDNQFTINSLAAQMGWLRRPPLTVIKVFMKADMDPIFGSYGLGDTALVSIVDPKHPDGTTISARIVSWEYRPASDDTVETVELVFAGDDLNQD